MLDTGALTLEDSIVAGSGSLPDVVLVSGTSGSASFSLIRDPAAPSGDTAITTGATDILGKDPQLGPLAENGGPTETMVPAPTSPVLDQGKSFGLTTDQRGLSRPFPLPTISHVPAGGDRSDIGAVETRTPSVAAVLPGSGRAGAQVVVGGVGFTGATEVLFGSKPASSLKVSADDAIVATAPVGSGPENVRVVAPLGESPVASADRFTFPTFRATVSKHPRPKLHGRTLKTGVKVSCPAAGLGCAGSFKAFAVIKGHKVRVGKGSIKLNAGHRKMIEFKLSAKALKALDANGHLKITLQIVVADGSAKKLTFDRSLKLKHKPK
jgi:hypothetical protein